MDSEHVISKLPHASRTAFVLGGGGSLGATQVGMLRELLVQGIRPDIVVGVSAGAINGAFFAQQPTLDRLNMLAGLWAGVSTREALGLSWRSLLGVLGMRDHVANPAGLRRILQRNLSYRSFAETVIPFHVLCAEMQTGRAVILSEGAVIDAILASAAIPGVFPAVVISGRLLVDGAVASRTPIEAAISLGATQLFVLPCGTATDHEVTKGGALARAMHAINLLGARQLRCDVERFSGQAAIHVVPPPAINCAPYDYSHGRELIERAGASTRCWLDSDSFSYRAAPERVLAAA